MDSGKSATYDKLNFKSKYNLFKLAIICIAVLAGLIIVGFFTKSCIHDLAGKSTSSSINFSSDINITVALSLALTFGVGAITRRRFKAKNRCIEVLTQKNDYLKKENKRLKNKLKKKRNTN